MALALQPADLPPELREPWRALGVCVVPVRKRPLVPLLYAAAAVETVVVDADSLVSRNVASAGARTFGLTM